MEEERAQTAAADAAEQSRVEAVAALERAMEHMRATMQQREHALGHARDAAHVAALPPGATCVAHAGDAHDVAALLKADGVLDDVVRDVLL